MYRNTYINKDKLYPDINIDPEFDFYLKFLLGHNLKSYNLTSNLYFIRITDNNLSYNLTFSDIKKKHKIKRFYFKKKNTPLERIYETVDFIFTLMWKRSIYLKGKNNFLYLFILLLIVIINPLKFLRRVKKEINLKNS
jgi:hypothetical protein